MPANKRRTERPLDSTNNAREFEAQSERKVLYVWQSMDQIFGKVWSDNFGNDPLGKVDIQNRMEQWVESLRYTPWPSIKAAVAKLRVFQKPKDYWVPDLPTFMGFVNRQSPRPPDRAPEPKGTWVDTLCGQLLIRYRWSLDYCPSPSMSDALYRAMKQTAESFNHVLIEDESLTANDVSTVLIKRLAGIKKEVATKEEEQLMKQRLLRQRAPSPSKEDSNFSMPNGVSTSAEPSISAS